LPWFLINQVLLKNGRFPTGKALLLNLDRV